MTKAEIREVFRRAAEAIDAGTENYSCHAVMYEPGNSRPLAREYAALLCPTHRGVYARDSVRAYDDNPREGTNC